MGLGPPNLNIREGTNYAYFDTETGGMCVLAGKAYVLM
jgi:hypothetical protein